ncbi:MAG: DUF262 domain-containing protein [Acidimicrobiia bacterium]
MTKTQEIPAAPIRTELDGIGHILRDRQLAVPVYQRSFSWGMPEVEQFWSDLRSALSNPEPDYFLGTVVLTPGQNRTWTIIDGQQRLATATMLLAAIRNAFLASEDEDRAAVIERDYVASRALRTAELEPRLRLNSIDAEFFGAAVIAHPDGQPEPTHPSHERILSAFRFLSDKVADEIEVAGANWDEALFRWAEFLEQAVRVIVVEVPTDADAFLIFETLNDRGLDLTIADLLKNYLFGLAHDEIEGVQRQWALAVELLEVPTEDQTFVTFLRHYWSSVQGATRERELYRSLRASVRSSGQAVRLAGELAQAAGLYTALLDSSHPFWSDRNPDSVAAVETLGRLRLEQFRPLQLATMQLFTEDELVRLVKSLVSWAVRGLIVGGIGGGTTERYYSDAAVAVRQGDAQGVEDVRQILGRIIPTDEAFTQAFEQRRESRTAIGRYVLSAIEREMSGVQEPALISNEEDAEITIAPVLPTATDDPAWHLFDPDEVDQWAKRVGNFVLVGRGEATAFRSLGWDGKLAAMEQSEFQTTRQALAAMRSTDHPASWSPDAIREHQQELAERVAQIWPRDPA